MSENEQGIMLVVRHPDFEVNNDEQTKAFLEGLKLSYGAGMRSEGMDHEADRGLQARSINGAVQAFFPYEGQVERAETSAALTIAMMSLSVVRQNQQNGGQQMMPAYSVEVVRNVTWPPED